MENLRKVYKAGSGDYWHGRVDSEQPMRWHEKIKTGDLTDELHATTNSYALLGFACDEGVKRNFGRPGAAAGPENLRKALANYAWHFDEIEFTDFGDIFCDKHDLESSQKGLSEAVAKLKSVGYKTILVGGGHEISYGHYGGLSNGSKVGIINIDSHFDLRATNNGSTSGTPFYQIAEDQKNRSMDFHYLCLGIQETSNTIELFERASELGVDFVFSEDVAEQAVPAIEAFAGKVDAIYLTIDLDVLDQIYAPGVSAPATMGLTPNEVIFLILSVINTGKLVSVDLAELNPKYDLDSRTSKLAARFIYEIVKYWV